MPDREAAKAWLRAVERNLDGAQRLKSAELGDLAVFHAQQCGEMAVKAFLAYRELDIEKTHVIPRLLRLAESAGDGFLDWMDEAAALTDWGFESRYPDDGLVRIPDDDVVGVAIGYAADLLEFVRGRIDAGDAEEA